MTIIEGFRQQVEDYLVAAKMDPTSFGKRSLNDPKFVFQLRAGRSPRAETLDRVIAWIDEHPVEQETEAAE